MEMIILVGLPGSGKTTYALQDLKDYTIINQDILGSRDECIKLAKKAIEFGKDVVIDRTNISKRQRATWINIAKYYELQDIICIYFETDINTCFERVALRQNHPTIARSMPKEQKRSIINKFNKEFEMPSQDEGFTSMVIV